MRKRRNKGTAWFLAAATVLGLLFAGYPLWFGAVQEQRSEIEIIRFYERKEQRQEAQTQGEEEMSYAELWEAVQAYNQQIFAECQSGLTGPEDFREPAVDLGAYGIDAFGVISIPTMEVELPVYLGAGDEQMAKGAAVLGQTSMPVGGANTNAVLAGHRGWKGAAYFRDIELLQMGDRVTLTNLWETLTYEVVEIRIIAPNDTDAIRIQPGRDLLTLLTCHPYASGGKYRYLIICERRKEGF